jgi:hypothetical protein
VSFFPYSKQNNRKLKKQKKDEGKNSATLHKKCVTCLLNQALTIIKLLDEIHISESKRKKSFFPNRLVYIFSPIDVHTHKKGMQKEKILKTREDGYVM